MPLGPFLSTVITQQQFVNKEADNLGTTNWNQSHRTICCDIYVVSLLKKDECNIKKKLKSWNQER